MIGLPTVPAEHTTTEQPTHFEPKAAMQARHGKTPTPIGAVEHVVTQTAPPNAQAKMTGQLYDIEQANLLPTSVYAASHTLSLPGDVQV